MTQISFGPLRAPNPMQASSYSADPFTLMTLAAALELFDTSNSINNGNDLPGLATSGGGPYRAARVALNHDYGTDPLSPAARIKLRIKLSSTTAEHLHIFAGGNSVPAKTLDLSPGQNDLTVTLSGLEGITIAGGLPPAPSAKFTDIVMVATSSGGNQDEFTFIDVEGDIIP